MAPTSRRRSPYDLYHGVVVQVNAHANTGVSHHGANAPASTRESPKSVRCSRRRRGQHRGRLAEVGWKRQAIGHTTREPFGPLSSATPEKLRATISRLRGPIVVEQPPVVHDPPPGAKVTDLKPNGLHVLTHRSDDGRNTGTRRGNTGATARCAATRSSRQGSPVACRRSLPVPSGRIGGGLPLRRCHGAQPRGHCEKVVEHCET